jgi:hypothetical protein
MLIAPLPTFVPPRPCYSMDGLPLLANPPAFRPSPELARIIGKLSSAGDIEEAWLEYDRKIDAFKHTDTGSRLWRNWTALKAAATGIIESEYKLLDAAFWAWRDSLIDHDALARECRAWLRRTLAGPQICGSCGGRFESIDALMSHQGYCSF